jgi:hypothetical protein
LLKPGAAHDHGQVQSPLDVLNTQVDAQSNLQGRLRPAWWGTFCGGKHVSMLSGLKPSTTNPSSVDKSGNQPPMKDIFF